MSKSNPMHHTPEQEILEPEIISNLPALDLSALTPAEIFVPGGLQPIVNAISADVRKEVYDVTTADGRKRIASVAHSIAKAKNALDKMGKSFNDDWNKKIKIVNTERNSAWDSLEKLQHEIRKPLTEYEAAEEAREQRIKSSIEEAEGAGRKATQEWVMLSVEAMQDRIRELEEEFATMDFMEFTDWAATAYPAAIQLTKEAIIQKTKYDKDQADLAALREKQAAADAVEIERKAKEEATEKERSAEQKRQQEEIDRQLREAKAAQEKAEADKKSADDRAAAAERTAKEASEQAEAARIAGEKAAQAAVEKERQRVADEAAAAAAVEEKRQAGQQHRAGILEIVRNEFQELFDSEGGMENCSMHDFIIALADAIAAGQIPHVTINF